MSEHADAFEDRDGDEPEAESVEDDTEDDDAEAAPESCAQGQ